MEMRETSLIEKGVVMCWVLFIYFSIFLPFFFFFSFLLLTVTSSQVVPCVSVHRISLRKRSFGAEFCQM